MTGLRPACKTSRRAARRWARSVGGFVVGSVPSSFPLLSVGAGVASANGTEAPAARQIIGASLAVRFTICEVRVRSSGGSSQLRAHRCPPPALTCLPGGSLCRLDFALIGWRTATAPSRLISAAAGPALGALPSDPLIPSKDTDHFCGGDTGSSAQKSHSAAFLCFLRRGSRPRRSSSIRAPRCALA
jgi:hypothetical protein